MRAFLLCGIIGAASANWQDARYLHNQSIYWYSCTDRCMDISHGETHNGNRVQIWKCNDLEMDQRFSIAMGGSGQIRWTAHPNKCIQVHRNHKTLELWDCQDTVYQEFKMEEPGGSGHIHWSADPSLCFDIRDGMRYNGNKINLYKCSDQTLNQRFFPHHPHISPGVLRPLPFEGCRAKVLDELNQMRVPRMSDDQCMQKCVDVKCGCAVFRESDHKCLIKQDCPDDPAPLPAVFPVEEVVHRVFRPDLGGGGFGLAHGKHLYGNNGAEFDPVTGKPKVRPSKSAGNLRGSSSASAAAAGVGAGGPAPGAYPYGPGMGGGMTQGMGPGMGPGFGTVNGTYWDPRAQGGPPPAAGVYPPPAWANGMGYGYPGYGPGPGGAWGPGYGGGGAGPFNGGGLANASAWGYPWGAAAPGYGGPAYGGPGYGGPGYGGGGGPGMAQVTTAVTSTTKHFPTTTTEATTTTTTEATTTVTSTTTTAIPYVHNTSLHWYSCTDRCLDVSAGKTTNGNGVQIWQCFPREQDQRWSVPVGGEGHIRWTTHPEKCLQVAADQERIEIWDCDEGNMMQEFKMDLERAAHVHWAQDQSKCLDVQDGRMFNGNRIALRDCSSVTISQQFFTVKYPDPMPYEGCRAEVLDNINGPNVPSYSEEECQVGCDSKVCECALYRVSDQKCLMLPDCPDKPTPLPDDFSVESERYKVLHKRHTTVLATTTVQTTATGTTTTRTTSTRTTSTRTTITGTTTTWTTTTRTVTTPWRGRLLPFFYRSPPDGADLQLLEEPREDSPPSGDSLRAGETFLCGEHRERAGVAYCRVGGEKRGWAPESVGNGLGRGNKLVHSLKVPRWHHQPASGQGQKLLTEPRFDATETSQLLPPGYDFDAIEEIEGPNGVLFLRSADPAGWVVDRSGAGVESVNLDEEMWKASESAPLWAEPQKGANATGRQLAPGQHFFVAAKVEDGNGEVVFVKPRDEEGWALATSAVRPLSQQPTTYVYDPDGQEDVRDPSAKDLPIQNEPSARSQSMGAWIRPDQVFDVIGEETDSTGVIYLKLADGRGWVAKDVDGKTVVSPFPRQPSPYLYDPRDLAPALVLSNPNAGAPQTGEMIQPGEVLLISERRTGSDAVEYLRLMDRPGWIAAEGAARPLRLREWEHLWTQEGSGLELLLEPALGAAPSGEKLWPGERFLALEEVEGDDGIIFLQPLGAKGWAASWRPGSGTLCRLRPAELWTYVPQVGDDGQVPGPLELLNEPELSSAPIGRRLPVGSTFYVDHKYLGDHGVVFIKPRGETGWAYDRTPETGHKCAPLEPQPSMWIYDPDDSVLRHNGSRPVSIVRQIFGAGPSSLRANASSRKASLSSAVDAAHVLSSSGPAEQTLSARRLALALGLELRPESVFAGIEREGPGGELYLELADGRGFIPKSHCAPWPRPMPYPSWIRPTLMAIVVLLLLSSCCWLRRRMHTRRFEPLKAPPSQRGMGPIKRFEETTSEPKHMARSVALTSSSPDKHQRPYHLALTFREKDSMEEKVFHFESHPLGLTFRLTAPIVINGFTEDGEGRELGVKEGMTLVAVGSEDPNEVFGVKHDVRNASYRDIWELLKTAAHHIPLR